MIPDKFNTSPPWKPLVSPYTFKRSSDTVINCEGLFYGSSGFAESMRNIAYELYKNGYQVTVNPHNLDDNNGFLQTPKGKIIHKLSTTRYSDHYPHISLQMTHPMGVRKKGYTIAYIMFETVDFPKTFIDHLNKEADEIWTPSSFNYKNIRRAGWNKPVFVMPLGVDRNKFNPDVKPLFRYPQFTFLSIMGWSERKGVRRLITAYLREFNEENVSLYLKSGWYDELQAKKEIEELQNKYPSNAKIILDFGVYSDEDHPRLYKSADCYVLPSLGEGWGLTYTESMSVGLPVIATRSTSMTDFMSDSNSFLIEVEEEHTEPACDWITPDYKGRDFSTPCVRDLQEKMRYVFENTTEAKRRGKNASVEMNKWTWEAASEKWIERLQEITEEETQNDQ